MKNLFRAALAAVLALGLAVPVGAQTIDPTVNGKIANAVVASKVDSRPTIYNFSPAMFPHWRTSLAQAAAGTARAKLVTLGDSTTAGAGAGTGGSGMVGARAKSWPMQLKALFNAAPARDENWFGDSETPDAGTAGISSYDPRITFAGSTWSRTGYGLGGAMLISTTGSDAITFTPTTAVDRCDVYYQASPGFGTITASDTGGSMGTFSTANAGYILAKSTITRASASTNPISLARSAAGNLIIAGLDCYNSTAVAVSIMNLGHYGITAVQVANSTQLFYPVPALSILQPNLVIINLSINGIRQGQTVAQYQTSIQTIITGAKTAGADVLLVWQHPDNAPVNPTLTAPYRAALLSLARANGVPMLDLSERFGSYSASSALYFDGVHLLASGYHDIAQAVLPLVTP